MISRSNVLIK
jgi:hypothetical protein